MLIALMCVVTVGWAGARVWAQILRRQRLQRDELAAGIPAVAYCLILVTAVASLGAVWLAARATIPLAIGLLAAVGLATLCAEIRRRVLVGRYRVAELSFDGD